MKLELTEQQINLLKKERDRMKKRAKKFENNDRWRYEHIYISISAIEEIIKEKAIKNIYELFYN